MNAKVINVVAKAAPVVKKFGPVIGAAVGGVFQALAEQKAAARLDNMEERIKELEQLFKQ